MATKKAPRARQRALSKTGRRWRALFQTGRKTARTARKTARTARSTGRKVARTARKTGRKRRAPPQAGTQDGTYGSQDTANC